MRQNPLLDSLLPRNRQGVLAVLLLDPEGRWYRTRLAAHLGVSPSSLQRDLEALTRAGILIRRGEGRQVYYQANRDCPIFPELQSILVKTAGIRDLIADALEALRERILVAFVHGSIARGEEVASSDVDLMVIGEATSFELAGALQQVRERLARPVNPTWYRAEEFEARVARGDHFLRTVLDEPKLFVIGGADELERARRGAPGRTPGDE